MFKRVISAAAALTLVCGLGACSGEKKDQQESSSLTTKQQLIPGLPSGFDLQAHRGGRGEYTEESATAFRKALELGVTTLEFDIVLSKDGVPVVWHDPEILETKCRDTAPVTEGDRLFPYVGKLVHQLTWAQLQTLRCDKKLEDFPQQQPAEDNQLIQLKDVFALTKQYNAEVYYNIETKVEGEKRSWSASPEEFVDAILKEVRNAEVQDKVAIQSFDWRTFEVMKKEAPSIPTIMLWDETTWFAGSTWIGSVSYQDVGGNILAAAERMGVKVLSPGYSNPYGLLPGQKDYKLVADKNFIDQAHAKGFRVVPWTINNEKILKEQIEAGADGIITDYPTMLRKVMEEKNMPLPKPYTVAPDAVATLPEENQ